MQTTFVLELQFTAPEEYRTVEIAIGNQGTNGNNDVLSLYSDSYYELRVFCMYDKVIAFDENNGSIRAEY